MFEWKCLLCDETEPKGLCYYRNPGSSKKPKLCPMDHDSEPKWTMVQQDTKEKNLNDHQHAKERIVELIDELEDRVARNFNISNMVTKLKYTAQKL